MGTRLVQAWKIRNKSNIRGIKVLLKLNSVLAMTGGVSKNLRYRDASGRRTSSSNITGSLSDDAYMMVLSMSN